MITLEMPSIFPVASHTDNVGEGTTFVVIKGLSKDGLEYVPLALKKGASRLILEKNVILSDALNDMCKEYKVVIEYVENTRKALAELSAQSAGYPARKLKLYAVTGTKGKTSSVWMMYHILCNMQVKAALLSTVGSYIGSSFFSTGMTTPQPDYIHQFLKLCVEHNVTHVVMEVAAQATTFFRLETLQFDALVFTNLEQEHGELYASLEEYFEAKKNICLFLKSESLLVVNYDAVYGKKLLQLYPYGTSFSFEDLRADYYCAFNSFPGFSKLTCVHNQKEYSFSYTQFIGLFNAYNLIGILILLLKKGFDYESMAVALTKIPSIPGRMEKYILKNGATVIIDYAHTPSSFEALFKTLTQNGIKLYIVFGAGGGKDNSKRPIMGALAAKYGARVFLTNDNPRYDDPYDIVNQIYNGILPELRSKVIIELDRAKAIELAIAESDEHTLILLLGKGPDEYQLVQGKKIFFSERLIALQHQ